MWAFVRHAFHKRWSFLCGLGILGYIIYHLVQGDRSIQSWIKLRKDLVVKEQELRTLNQEKTRLEQEIFLLRDDHPDPELLGEYLLKMLHYAPPHNWMILMTENPYSQNDPK